MATASNPKLHCVEPPVWRPFRGLSVLYDPPGCAALTGCQPLEHLPSAHARDDRLYRELRRGAKELASVARDAGIDVALLPWRTYHVTLCDTVNDGNLDVIRGDRRDEVATVLSCLPDRLLGTSDTVRALRDQALLWSVATAAVSFTVDTVAVRGLAVVAELVPVADGRSQRAFDQHVRARAQFGRAVADRFGLEVPTWQPHVTVGYLGSRTDADRVRDRLAGGWSTRVAARTAGTPVTFRSAALYGFTDMASYWRLGT